MEKKKQGGARANAGRKPIPNEKRRIQQYYFVEQQYIDKVGSKEAKAIAEQAIIKAAKRIVISPLL